MEKHQLADAVREGMRARDRDRSRNALIGLAVLAVIVFGFAALMALTWPT